MRERGQVEKAMENEKATAGETGEKTSPRPAAKRRRRAKKSGGGAAPKPPRRDTQPAPAQAQTTAEPPEAPEQPEAPERPEAPEPAQPADAANEAPEPPAPKAPDAAAPEREPAGEPEPSRAEPPDTGEASDKKTEQEPEDEPESEPELTPEQRAAEERRRAEITRTVQVSIEKIAEAAAEREAQAEWEEPPAEPGESGLARAAKRLAGWLLLVVAVAGVIAAAGVCWLYRKATPDMIPAVTVTVEGQSLEPMTYSWKVPVAGNYFKRTYTDTVSAAPAALDDDFGGGIMRLKVTPADCTADITVTDAAGNEVFDGTAQEFSSFRFTENGDYAAKLVVSSGEGYQTEPTVTGSQTYEFTFTVRISAAVRLNTQSVTQGGVAALRVTGQQDADERPALSAALPHTDFYKSGDGWVAYLPAAPDAEPGSYDLRVTVGGETQTVSLTVRERTASYRDVSSKSELVTPYVGADDTPQAVSELFDTAGDTLCWAETGFASPFSDSVEITLPYGLTEYVGRTQAERRSSTGTGRTSVNAVLSGRCSLLAPADGKVLLARKLDGVGNTVVIEHGAGVKTIFYGLRTLEVEAGDTVAQGDLLGQTNSATVAEVRVGAVPVEPLSILRGQCDALRGD